VRAVRPRAKGGVMGAVPHDARAEAARARLEAHYREQALEDQVQAVTVALIRKSIEQHGFPTPRQLAEAAVAACALADVRGPA
jgi:hypothetical protein